MKKISIIALILIIIGVIVIALQPSTDTTEELPMDTETDMMESEETFIPLDEFMVPTKEISGTLEDVTDGNVVRGLTTSPETTGQATAMLFGETDYQLSVYFENLPAPQGDDFYEGWIVRRGDVFSIISTGVLELEDASSGTYTNVFSQNEDRIDHDFYVLTIEPNDGDPAPADHILEGVMR